MMNRQQSFMIEQRPLRREPEVLAATERLGPRLRTLTSEVLFRGASEIGIDHDGALYRLKITRQGKLILNK